MEESSEEISNQGTDNIEEHSALSMLITNLWGTVKKLDVFRVTPQNPHFESFQGYDECVRKGMALGCMLSFATLADKASSLTLDVAESVIGEMSRSCEYLAYEGFDVSVIRSRINRIQEARTLRDKLQAETNDLKNQILTHCQERTKVEEEIQIVDDQIKHLQEGKIQTFDDQIKHLKEYLVLLNTSKNYEDKKIASLEETLQIGEQKLKNVLCAFRGDQLVECSTDVSTFESG